MTFFLQTLITGFALGMVYALVAIGIVIIVKCSGVFNIAQAQIVMFGAYLGYTLLVTFHLPLLASLLGAIAVAIVMGLLIERLTLRPMVGQPLLAIIFMTLALATVLEGIVTLVWGAGHYAYFGALPAVTLRIGELSVAPESVISMIVSIVVVAGLMLLFRYSKSGLAMRATADDQQIVQSAGIRVTTVYALAWIIACIVSIVGGMLIGSVSGVSKQITEIGFKAFAVVLLGGLESIEGAIAAGLILGVLENLATGYLDPLLPHGSAAGVLPWVVIIIVLTFRPYGLFGLRGIERI